MIQLFSKLSMKEYRMHFQFQKYFIFVFSLTSVFVFADEDNHPQESVETISSSIQDGVPRVAADTNTILNKIWHNEMLRINREQIVELAQRMIVATVKVPDIHVESTFDAIKSQQQLSLKFNTVGAQYAGAVGVLAWLSLRNMIFNLNKRGVVTMIPALMAYNYGVTNSSCN